MLIIGSTYLFTRVWLILAFRDQLVLSADVAYFEILTETVCS